MQILLWTNKKKRWGAICAPILILFVVVYAKLLAFAHWFRNNEPGNSVCFINMESSLTQRNWWAFCFQCLCRVVLILHIRKEVEEGNLPADVASSLEELYYNYKNAVKTAGFDLCSIFNVLLSDCCSSRLANILLSGSENWWSKCIWDHAFKYDGFIWSGHAGCTGSASYSDFLFPSQSALAILFMFPDGFSYRASFFAESIYLSTVSQSYPRTIRLLHVWSELH